MNSIEATITIPGTPIAKARAKHSTRGGFVRTYDPQEKLKRSMILALQAAIPPDFLENRSRIELEASNFELETFFSIRLVFHMPIPDSLTNARKNAKLWHSQHTIKPDLDNLVKFILDCSNGLLFPDDSKITCLVAFKRYSINPRTEIYIKMEKIHLHEKEKKIITLFTPEELMDLMSDCKSLCSMSASEINFTANALLFFANKFADKLQKIKKIGEKYAQ